MRKRDRQQLIESLIVRKRLSTQADLQAALKLAGCEVTQATVSRDMREMGVQKGTDSDGMLRYVVPPPQVRRDPEKALTRVLGSFGATVQAAQNLVVVRSEPGTAPTVGLAIDGLERDDIIGTIAGDDTVLLVLGDAAAARNIVKFLSELMRA